MEITAHQRFLGVNEEDEPFTFVWMRDEQHDFVFSLSRPAGDDNTTPIEYMVLDQMWERVTDIKCRIDNVCICAEVPPALRQYTCDSDTIMVYHDCTGDALHELVDILKKIFEGKSGLEVQIA